MACLLKTCAYLPPDTVVSEYWTRKAAQLGHRLAAAHVNANTFVPKGNKRCSACQRFLPHSKFSRTQHAHSWHERRCKDCVLLGNASHHVFLKCSKREKNLWKVLCTKALKMPHEMAVYYFKTAKRRAFKPDVIAGAMNSV